MSISAFGVEHGEIAKYKVIVTPETKAKRRALSQKTSNRSKAIWGGGLAGAAGAALARRPKLAIGLTGATPVAVVGNAAASGHQYRKQGLSTYQQPRVT